MGINGIMDGWQGDEYECTGRCGQCSRCERALEKKADDDIDRYFLEMDDY